MFLKKKKKKNTTTSDNLSFSQKMCPEFVLLEIPRKDVSDEIYECTFLVTQNRAISVHANNEGPDKLRVPISNQAL